MLGPKPEHDGSLGGGALSSAPQPRALSLDFLGQAREMMVCGLARPGAARPIAARTRLLLDGPILPTLLRLSAPNVLNLLAIAGMITFDGLFLGRLGPDVLAGASLAFPFVMLVQHTAASGMGG